MNLPDPLTLIVLTALLAMAPFLAVMATSYVKLVVVLSLVRNALGIQQIPPNMVLNGLAVVLTIYIMGPVVKDTYDRVAENDLSQINRESLQDILEDASEPIRQFLITHTTPREKRFFYQTTRTLWRDRDDVNFSEDSLLILIPAFSVSELTAAFQVGFLLYLPFIAIDLIVSNILLAMGMMMVSPMTISLPFKLLLFVLIDGWTRLVHGLVTSYAIGGG